jgi:hypothetical protein
MFGIKVGTLPDCDITVEAFDSEDRSAIPGLHVLMHPYRAVTDENGMATLRVAKGRYKMHLSGFRYVAQERTIDVTGSMITRAELTAEPKWSDRLW